MFVRGVVSAVLAAGVVVAGSLVWAGPAQADHAAVVEQQVRDELAADGSADFWVVLRDRADLAGAAGITNRAAQGRFVHSALTANANTSQAGLKEMLAAEGVAYQSFWIANTIKVTGDADLVRRIAARPEVREIRAGRVFELPEPDPGAVEAEVDAVEWNLDRVGAPRVWNEFGVTGEGIVVGSIDSGVQFDHPALVRSYRGNNGDGSFDHNYNWFDPARACGNPSLVPCDAIGHGTHTMGTIVGDDGGDNRIGVAPGAKWITARACGGQFCSDAALVAAGQWMLAPTDLQGNNPDPARRPHVVNASWRGSLLPGVIDMVRAWAAAGILPVFANSDLGPGCGTAQPVPAVIPESYAVGAFDVENRIAPFSARGPGAGFFAGIKPNIAAPGVNVRSSILGGGYSARTGTSMAAPHVAGAAALVWSAAPALARDLAATRALLDQGAIDVEDLQCGGTAGDNNVWGEGRLDVLAAVEAAVGPDRGTLAGAVTDASSGEPVAGATVRVTGPVSRERTTGTDGRYAINLPAGDYQVSVSGFGYTDRTEQRVIAAGQTTTVDFVLAPERSVTVSGQVLDGSGHGWPLYARVAVLRGRATVVSTFTDPVTGWYNLRLPANASHTLQITPQYPGYADATRTVAVGRSVTIVDDVAVAVDRCDGAPGYQPTDGGGCQPVAGGLVVGNVIDRNTGAGVDRAIAASVENPGERARSVATPDDPALDDGFYWLFSAQTGSRQFTGSARNYAAASEVAHVAADGVAEASFSLAAGRLTVTETEVSRQLRLGQTGQVTVTMRNTGTAAARLGLGELSGSFQMLGEPAAAGGPAAGPWTGLAAYPQNVMDNTAEAVDGVVYSFGGDNGTLFAIPHAYRLDPHQNRWTAVASLPAERKAPVSAVIDGKIYIIGGWDVTADPGTGNVANSTVFVYDPATDTYGQAADMPAGRAAAGVAVLDGQLYVVGGCVQPACAAEQTVWRYDPAGNAWETLPQYPERAAWLACGGLDGQVVCAGGVESNGSRTPIASSSTYAYDPTFNEWVRLTDMPYDNWGMAGEVIDGRLVVSGGAFGPDITNRGAAYDPATDTWTDIEPSNHAVYRGGSACGFYKVGGSTGPTNVNTPPVADVERHPGLGCAASGSQVSWLSVNPPTLTLQPGQQVRAVIGLDARVDQPGTYTSGVRVDHDTPYEVGDIAVTMEVTPPNNWGKVTGTVTGVSCQGVAGPLFGARVQINGLEHSTTLRTDRDGRFAYWFGVSNNPLQVIAAADGHIPQVRTSRVIARQTTVENFALSRICVSGSADAI